jgi:hypothetical protein
LAPKLAPKVLEPEREPAAEAAPKRKHKRKSSPVPNPVPAEEGAKATGGSDALDEGPVLSVRELLCLVLEIDQAFQDSSRLTQALKKYEISSFAAENFRQHLKGSFIERKFSPKVISIQELISYQAGPLAKPLLKKIPGDKKRVASLLFELLLEFMNLRPRQRNQVATLHLILGILRTNPQEMTDEFYFQVVKQTNNNKNPKSAQEVWELLSIVSSIMPSTEAVYPYLVSYIGAKALSSDTAVSKSATFVLLRFLTRHYIGQPLKFIKINPAYPENVPADRQKGRLCFGISLYECLYYQRATHPKLPIPYVVHYIVSLLHEKGAARTQGFLRLRADEDRVREILIKVNQDVTAIASGDVHVVGAVFKAWLRDLADPIVPIELADPFVEMADLNKFRQFADKLPRLHRLTLFYVIGYLKELAANAERLGLDKSDIATQFGPLLVNPSRVSRRHPELVQNLTELAVAFCSKLVDSKDPNPIYPLPDGLIGETGQEVVPKAEAEVKKKPKAPPAAKPPQRDSEGDSNDDVSPINDDYYQDD